ncbi:MAG: cob(I)yrinic acid a,c-diamide adenosyltransferase [Thermotogae bacterium]|nr:cob(I)yrinic acid a,c-diamide adenosyltransferase [Thermotogota bacterium]
MRITKVYTKVGDGGQTYLADGSRVFKDHPRVVAYGDVDELNSHLGVVRAQLEGELRVLDGLLGEIQNDLFILGGDLATPPNAPFKVRRVTESMVNRLEGLIDRFNSELPPLEEFILPAGGKVSAYLHVARSVCRRAERAVVRAMRNGESLNENIQIYLNRLSDLLFVLARWCNHKASGKEEFAKLR